MPNRRQAWQQVTALSPGLSTTACGMLFQLDCQEPHLAGGPRLDLRSPIFWRKPASFPGHYPTPFYKSGNIRYFVLVKIR